MKEKCFMKKLVLLATLLFIQHNVMATCQTLGIINWTMNIKNKTSNQLTISCGNVVIPAGKTGNAVGLIKSTCDTATNTLNYECTYTDSQGRSGKLSLTPYAITPGASCGDSNTIVPISLVPGASSISKGTPPVVPYFCKFTNSTIVDTRDDGNCKNSFGQPVPASYQVLEITGYFVISQPITYEIKWKNILTNLSKGQVMAGKLANFLMKTGDYASYTAKYDQNTVTIDLVTHASNDPYLEANCQTPEDCNQVNKV